MENNSIIAADAESDMSLMMTVKCLTLSIKSLPLIRVNVYGMLRGVREEEEIGEKRGRRKTRWRGEETKHLKRRVTVSQHFAHTLCLFLSHAHLYQYPPLTSSMMKIIQGIPQVKKEQVDKDVKEKKKRRNKKQHHFFPQGLVLTELQQSV